MPQIRTAAAAAVAAALMLPGAASAHVTLQPNTAPADGFTRLDVRVPNERDDSATVKVDVQFPPGFETVSYEPRQGWKTTVERADGGAVSRITWSGGVIDPGEFVDFGLSLHVPAGEAGDKLTFKALQTYDDGEVVRWIGPEDADEPAPTVTLTAGADGDTSVSSAGAQEPAESEAVVTRNGGAEVDDGGDGLAIAALAVGLVALAVAGGALVAARRSSEAR